MQVPSGTGTPFFMSRKITLKDGEIKVAKLVAAERQGANRSKGIPNQKVSDASDWDVELLGVAGELAFCKAFNYWPDLTNEPRSGGYDLKTRDGKTMDVKTTGWLRARLVVALNKADAGVDRYALVIGGIPYFTIVGYADAEDVFKEENLDDLGHGLAFAIDQSKLHKFD